MTQSKAYAYKRNNVEIENEKKLSCRTELERMKVALSAKTIINVLNTLCMCVRPSVYC